MHQDTSDALELLAEALSDNPGDATIALTTFDALPGVMIARTMQAATAAGRGAHSRNHQRTGGRIGRATPNAAGHKIGDTLYFKSNTTKYLYGLPVTVVGTNEASVNVNVPNEPQYRRFAGNAAARCPNSIMSATNPLSA